MVCSLGTTVDIRRWLVNKGAPRHTHDDHPDTITSPADSRKYRIMHGFFGDYFVSRDPAIACRGHLEVNMKTASWREKIAKPKQSKKVVLDTDFAGIKAGSRLFVATPAIVDQYLRRIPRGEVRTIERMRNELARRNQCDATCPVSTAIFLRMSAEAALEDLAEGKVLDEVTPFWRLIDPTSKIAGKLSVAPSWIAEQRSAESPSKR